MEQLFVVHINRELFEHSLGDDDACEAQPLDGELEAHLDGRFLGVTIWDYARLA